MKMILKTTTIQEIGEDKAEIRAGDMAMMMKILIMMTAVLRQTLIQGEALEAGAVEWIQAVMAIVDQVMDVANHLEIVETIVEG